MTRLTERIRCPYCGSPIAYIGNPPMPRGSAMTITYSTLQGSDAVEVRASICSLTDPTGEIAVADITHHCRMLGVQ